MDGPPLLNINLLFSYYFQAVHFNFQMLHHFKIFGSTTGGSKKIAAHQVFQPQSKFLLSKFQALH